jgi:hypothetical protein
MRNTHLNQIEILSHENAKMDAMLNTKTIELENLVK